MPIFDPASYQHQHPQVEVKTLQVAASPGLVGTEGLNIHVKLNVWNTSNDPICGFL